MKLNIAVLPGDGIGPEVMSMALKAINHIAKEALITLEYKEAARLRAERAWSLVGEL